METTKQRIAVGRAVSQNRTHTIYQVRDIQIKMTMDGPVIAFGPERTENQDGLLVVGTSRYGVGLIQPTGEFILQVEPPLTK